MKSGSIYLAHMLECIRRIEENTSAGQEAFLRSHTLQDAVPRNLQTMAESSQRLSASAKGKCPEIDWSRIAAFRNVLAHDYLGIDLERVWQIVQEEIPPLKKTVSQLIAG